MSDKVLTTNEAAERLGVTRRQINVLIADGKLPAEKHGRDYVIKESDLSKMEPKSKRGRPTKTTKK